MHVGMRKDLILIWDPYKKLFYVKQWLHLAHCYSDEGTDSPSNIKRDYSD